MKDLTANEKEHINGGMIIEPVGFKFIQIVLDMLKWFCFWDGGWNRKTDYWQWHQQIYGDISDLNLT